MIRFIDEHRNRFSIEFICQTLNTHREGGFLSSRGYRQSKARGLSSRALRDAALVEHFREVHSESYSVYGVRKKWRVLQHQGIDIGREQTARLMRSAGLSGKGKGEAPITTRKPKGPDLRPDLVNREFKALALIGCGWRTLPTCEPGKALCTPLSSRMCSPGGSPDGHCRIRCALQALPLQALNQAIVCAKETTGLIHHCDHGSQGGFNWLSQHPEHGGMRRWLPRTGVRRPARSRRGCGVSGVRTGRCGLRCVPRVGRFRHGQCNASSGV